MRLQYKYEKNLCFCFVLMLLLNHFFCPFIVNNALTERKTRSLNPAYKRSPCSLLSWWPSSFIRLPCDVVAWQQRATQRKGAGETRGADQSESRETSKEKHIILLCTVCRLNLHNPDIQQHKKRAKKLEIRLQKEYQKK